MESINFEECNRKIEEIASLKDNWNTNGAEKFSLLTIINTKNLLKYFIYQPEIFPTAIGAIQIEYEKENGEYLEIEVYNDKYNIFMINAAKKEEEYEFGLDETYRIVNLVKIFVNGPVDKAILFTGAFNPPTIAHYHMVHSALRNKNIEFNYVIFALSNEIFLSKKQKKLNDWYFSEKQRLDLILEMTAHNPNVLIYGIEQGYTYQVLCDAKKTFNCKDLYFACGSDKLSEIHRWGYNKQLLSEFCFYILLRGTDKNLKETCDELFKNTKYIIATDNEKYKDISATQVRRMMDNNEDCSTVLERHVYDYVQRKGLKW